MTCTPVEALRKMRALLVGHRRRCVSDALATPGDLGTQAANVEALQSRIDAIDHAIDEERSAAAEAEVEENVRKGERASKGEIV